MNFQSRRHKRLFIILAVVLGVVVLLAVIGTLQSSVPTSSTSAPSVATAPPAMPTGTAVPTDSSSTYKYDFAQWAGGLASFIKYCQLATGEQVWTTPVMSLHDFLSGGGWNNASDVCNAEVDNFTSMTPPLSSADYLPAAQVTPYTSNVNPSPNAPYARMTKAKDMLATWARHEAEAAHGCDFAQCTPPDQATQDLLSQAKAIIVAVSKQAGVALNPDTLLTPNATSLPVSS